MITKERNNELRNLARRRNEASRPDPEAHALAVKVNAGKATKQERKRFNALMELPGTGGRFVPAFLESEAEAERVRALQSELTNAALALSINALASTNETLTEGHTLLSKALSGWVLRTLKAPSDRLTDAEARLLALLITKSGTTKEGATKYPAQRDIARRLGVSAMAVKRREDKLRRDHPNIAQWLIEQGITRTPRGTRKATVTKRKKKR